VLGYAFSTDGSLDPATKLLDVGLDRHTPLQARDALLADPLHMSVAIHELTHFVSLENTLGHVIGFLAMRARTLGASIDQAAVQGEPMNSSWITLYAAWQLEYRLLVELWRPVLEGLAIYAQVHEPDQDGDALIEPVQVLLTWSALIFMQGTGSTPNSAAWQTGYHQFLEAAYQAIRKGPTLRHGKKELAVSLEFVSPASLKPYSLGHAYIRALQLAIAEKSATYESSERFFNLVIRILRSSARGLLSDAGAWEQPLMTDRIYGWVDIVRQAPPSRVQALAGLHDAVDVLHFLATGEERRGYDGTGRGDAAAVRQIVPQFWQEFEIALAQRPGPAEAPQTETPADRAARVVAGWMRGNMALNLSSNGNAFVVGWIPKGLAPLHALALKVDGVVWWLGLTDEDLAKIVRNSGALPQLPSASLGDSTSVTATSHRLLIDSYVNYVQVDPAVTGASRPIAMPDVSFRLWNPRTPDAVLHAQISGARPGIIGPHLVATIDETRAPVQFNGLSRLRQDVRDALSSSELVGVLRHHGRNDLASHLESSLENEELAVSRVVANAERSILATLLQRAPSGPDLELLERGVGVVPHVEKLAFLITATYSASGRVDAPLAGDVRTLNSLAKAVLGKRLFEIDARGVVRYQGLWGDA
jgi:hypothetical protein